MAFAERLREVMRIKSKDSAFLSQVLYGEDKKDIYDYNWEIHHLVVGKRSPSRTELELIAKSLDVSILQLIGKKKITDSNIKPYFAFNDTAYDLLFASFEDLNDIDDKKLLQFLKAIKNYIKENK